MQHIRKTVVFLGPTLSAGLAKQYLDTPHYLSPAAQGDIYDAYMNLKPDAIVLIDGLYENIPSVWHKEILFVMSQGVHVFGAGSMGAIRASELSPFGMIGMGDIYEKFLSGEYEDDDEVAISHGPADIGYPALSDAMVNIRATLEAALQERIINEPDKIKLISMAKEMFYKNRSWSALANKSVQSGLDLDELFQWVKSHKIDAKKRDAISLLQHVHNLEIKSPNTVRYAFHETAYWKKSTLRGTEERI